MEIKIPENSTNGEVVKLIFDERGYNAIREKMEHTLWWNQQYELEKTE